MNIVISKKKINNVYYLYIIFSIGMLLLALTVFLVNNNNLIKIATNTRQDTNRLDYLDRLMKIAALFTDAHNSVNDVTKKKNFKKDYELFIGIDQNLQHEIAQFEENIKKFKNSEINLDINQLKKSREQLYQYADVILNTDQSKIKFKTQNLIPNFNKLSIQVQNQILKISHLIRFLQVQEQESRLQQLNIYSKKQHYTIIVILSVLLGILVCGLKNFFYFQHKSKKLQTELSQEKNKLQQILSALNENAIISETDPQGKIISVNNEFCRISGYTREELIGKDHRIIKSGLENKVFFKNIWRKIISGKTWAGEIRNLTKNGEIYTVSTIITPLFKDNNKIERFYSVRFDVTEQKKLYQQLLEAQSISKIGGWKFNIKTQEQTWTSEHYKIF